MKVIELTGTSSAGHDGDVTITETDKFIGFLEKIEYDYSTGNGTAQFVITSEGPIAEPIVTVPAAGTADTVFYPRAAAIGTAGAAISDSAEKIFITGPLKAVCTGVGDGVSVRLIAYLSDE